MGGFGSGVKASRKALVEDSWALSAHRIVTGLGLPVPESNRKFRVVYSASPCGH